MHFLLFYALVGSTERAAVVPVKPLYAGWWFESILTQADLFFRGISGVRTVGQVGAAGPRLVSPLFLIVLTSIYFKCRILQFLTDMSLGSIKKTSYKR